MVLSAAIVIAVGFDCSTVHADVQISDNSVQGLWHFNGNSNDDSHNNFNGTDTNITYATSSCKLGSGCAYFDGSSSYISIGDHLDPGTGDFSMAAWVKGISSISGTNRIMDKRGSGTSGYAWVSVAGQQYTGFGFANPTWTVGNATTSSIDNTWHLIVVTVDRSGNETQYVDGAPAGSNDISGQPGNLDVSVPFVFGRGANYAGDYYQGYIDEFVWFNKVISTTTIADLWNGGSGQEVSLATSSPYIVTSTLQQFKFDGTTTLGEGSTTTESGAVISATLESSSTSNLELQVEVTTGTLSGVPTFTGSPVAPGGTASTTLPNLPNGSYKWQARVIDADDSATSSWQSIGTIGDVDFVVAAPSPPTLQISNGSVQGLWAFNGNSSDTSPNGFNGSDTDINYDAGPCKLGLGCAYFNGDSSYISIGDHLDPGSGDFSVAGWVKTAPDPSASSRILDKRGAGTSGYVWHVIADTEDTRFSIANPTWTPGDSTIASADGSWHFVAVTVDRDGNATQYVDGAPAGSWDVSGQAGNLDVSVPFVFGRGSNYAGDYYQGYMNEFSWFNKVLSTTTISQLYNGGSGVEVCTTYGCGPVGLSLSGLAQYRSDATSTITPGGSTTESTVDFGAILDSTATTTEQLQVEVKPAGVAFSNIANVTSNYVNPGSEAIATSTNFANAAYHWQARIMDYGGATSSWQLFGGSVTSTDFTVAVPMSAYFNGSSSWAWPASNVEFSATDPWTIEFWYRTTDPTSSVVEFIDAQNGSGSSGYSIERNLDQGITFDMNCASGTVQFSFAAVSSTKYNGGPNDPQGIWHQVAITKNSGTSISAFTPYFDGILEQSNWIVSSTLSGNCFNVTSTDSIWIGGDSNSTSTPNFLSGDVDELQVWNTERSSSSIANSMSTEATSTTGLRGLWHFNGTSTELVKGYAPLTTSSLAFATSSPFGHFLLDQRSLPTSVHDDQLLWYASGSSYTSEMTAGEAKWNALGGATIAQTSSLSAADLIVSDFNDGVDLSWVGQWIHTENPNVLQFNQYSIGYYGYGSTLIQHTAEHELGHALGLGHSYLGNVMNYYLTSGVDLGNQDIIDYDYLKDQEIWGQ